MSGRPGDATLFAAARRGDAAAQAELAEIVHTFARAICRGGGPAGAVAVDWQDVAQEALHKLFHGGLDAYRGAGSERSYLYSVVKTTVIQISRGARRRQAREIAAGAPDPKPDVHPGDRLDVQRILSQLPDDCRSLIERAFFDGETYEELARELGLAESSVRAKLSRCIGRARRIAAGEETL